ncbi:MAG: hypothetical protein PHV79_01135 [Clostridia bacterium]|jgi:hypothetical protein|nr:hypothetical protein [Clostridia bacterium]MDD3862447.1 hypothetical protein [Clostridia bacterium]MDD4408268.1 hypothetical protein [Clostridia bacterium]
MNQIRKAQLEQFHDMPIALNRVYVQFLNLKNSPNIRLFVISDKNPKLVKFLDNAEILDTTLKDEKKALDEEYENMRLDMEYYYNPILKEIGKFEYLHNYLKEHISDVKGAIPASDGDLIKEVEKQVKLLIIDSSQIESEKNIEDETRYEIEINELVDFQKKLNERLQDYWPAPIATLKQVKEFSNEATLTTF